MPGSSALHIIQGISQQKKGYIGLNSLTEKCTQIAKIKLSKHKEHEDYAK